MKELKELRFNENNIQLQDNLVKGSILPERIAELERTITIQSNTVIEGPVYAHKLEIQQGDSEIRGAVYTHLELYVNSEAKGNIIFKKSVGSANSIVSRAQNCNIMFYSDINARSVTLYNSFVAGSIYADEIILENCVVIGGVFATQTIDFTNSIIGTFNSPSVKAAQMVSLLLPSAFSIEKIVTIPGTKFYNLSLADLGSLYKGMPQALNSGRIEMNLETDEVKTTLSNEETQKTLRSYTVIGKVLAADLLDIDKFQNHFLLTAASLGSQLLKVYDMGVNAEGKSVALTFDKIKDFFFDILHGKIEIQKIDGKFDISQIIDRSSSVGTTEKGNTEAAKNHFIPDQNKMGPMDLQTGDKAFDTASQQSSPAPISKREETVSSSPEQIVMPPQIPKQKVVPPPLPKQPVVPPPLPKKAGSPPPLPPKKE